MSAERSMYVWQTPIPPVMAGIVAVSVGGHGVGGFGSRWQLAVAFVSRSPLSGRSSSSDSVNPLFPDPRVGLGALKGEKQLQEA